MPTSTAKPMARLRTISIRALPHFNGKGGKRMSVVHDRPQTFLDCPFVSAHDGLARALTSLLTWLSRTPARGPRLFLDGDDRF
jgi:hypothetical protein